MDIKENIGISENTPRRYDVMLKEADKEGLLVLREERLKKKKTMVGGINHRATCIPKDGFRYKRQLAERFKKSTDRAATQEYKLDERRGNRLLTQKHVFSVTKNPQQSVVRDPSDKRVRIEESDLEELLFKAFEEHQYYALKDLVNITNQPQEFVKTTLRKLCVYHQKGKHKNLYELKPEYRAGDIKGESETMEDDDDA
ncbi:hypothetical protein SARC_05854 [Sphaeroforma arctica JP610]|uniref:TFIIF beta subunit HTH domain-containing protein n=1 Tax=Sphaeroforma arctica JP610 TaxID=667725 RepID=A0A0L0FYZ4_9EUKA|nr:hypothetical protein SARC_05854 [Sphaeroforma arctica JP610]KNC81849.1 hypothetical protein SARC_05854 [Sphaeroforma arctica JP610]|eukprot:XP_014155751.1 hypothetical protein SARC_05854 [Sphaeroforma arctica JP610]